MSRISIMVALKGPVVSVRLPQHPLPFISCQEPATIRSQEYRNILYITVHPLSPYLVLLLGVSREQRWEVV